MTTCLFQGYFRPKKRIKKSRRWRKWNYKAGGEGVRMEVGEGLFGVSFKMKGPEGNIKTTINPIKTLTPRFIQKIIERNRIK